MPLWLSWRSTRSVSGRSRVRIPHAAPPTSARREPMTTVASECGVRCQPAFRPVCVFNFGAQLAAKFRHLRIPQVCRLCSGDGFVCSSVWVARLITVRSAACALTTSVQVASARSVPATPVVRSVLSADRGPCRHGCHSSRLLSLTLSRPLSMLSLSLSLSLSFPPSLFY